MIDLSDPARMVRSPETPVAGSTFLAVSTKHGVGASPDDARQAVVKQELFKMLQHEEVCSVPP